MVAMLLNVFILVLDSSIVKVFLTEEEFVATNPTFVT